MTVEVTQQAQSALEDLSLGPQAVTISSKVDPFSLLPPELLDDIYDLAADEYKLAILPPSKLLHPHHQRAFHKRVNIDSNDKLELFSKMLDSHPHLAILVKHLSFRWNEESSHPPRALMFDLFSKLPALTRLEPPSGWPQVLEMVESGDNPGPYLTRLKTCRLSSVEVTSAHVKALSLLPELRKVEFWSSTINVDSPLIIANQVEEVVVRMPQSFTLEGMAADPSSFLRFFPSAKIVSLGYNIRTRSQYDCLQKVLPPLAPFLRSLHLSSGDPIRNLPLIDYSDFSSLRTLYVEIPWLLDPSNLLENSFPFPHLVDLYLIVRDFHPDILKLFRGPQRLRHLRSLELEYCYGRGLHVDIEKAEAELEANRWDAEGKGWALVENCLSMEDMEGGFGDWVLPFINYSTKGGFYKQEVGGFENGLRVMEEMEKLAKKAGVVFYSETTREEIERTFWLQVLEYHSRGVVRAYLRGDPSVIKDARQIAALHNIPLPPLLVDLDDEISRDKLEYYEVDMLEAFDIPSPPDEGWRWSTYNLRYREEGEADSSLGGIQVTHTSEG